MWNGAERGRMRKCDVYRAAWYPKYFFLVSHNGNSVLLTSATKYWVRLKVVQTQHSLHAVLLAQFQVQFEVAMINRILDFQVSP